MTKLQGFFGLQSIAVLWLLIIINIKGAVYDGLKTEQDKNYSKNHTFSFYRGRFRFSLPWIISDKSTDLYISKMSKTYNKNSMIFWINIIAMIIIYNLAY